MFQLTTFVHKRSLLITLATGPLPKVQCFWAGFYTCFPHRTKVEAWRNRRRIGHHQDVFLASASGSCRNCGDNLQMRDNHQHAYRSVSSAGMGTTPVVLYASSATPAGRHARLNERLDTSPNLRRRSS
ncbi:hypothetical protein MRX96_001313 [Rhipicephalus microplus]